MTMIRVVLSEIPAYLHNSAFYKSLNFDECDSDEILVPVGCFKLNDTISSV